MSRCLSVKPTTIKRMPPDFLFSARSRLPIKTEATSGGHFPEKIMLTNHCSKS